MNRRSLLLGGTTLGLGTALQACDSGPAPSTSLSAEAPARAGVSAQPVTGSAGSVPVDPKSADPIVGLVRLGAPPWPTFDPFLFCVHHRDVYPTGNAALGPSESLAGRNIGQDFGGKDGWNMYHGEVVPGFPRHPHRGFETVTITRRGYVDHSDSLGATARYGEGDVQWLTAGSGIAHAEMFPLLDESSRNPTELFQIWLNLPARSKFVAPHFAMFWNGQIPERQLVDAGGRSTSVRVIAGQLGGERAPAPPPNSWAAQADADVAIWSIRMQPGARWQLPAAPPSTERTLYFFAGGGLRVGERDVPVQTAVRLRGGASVLLTASATPRGNGAGAGSDVEVLLLAGRPIGEPVVARGPFVMNDLGEIAQARNDYQRTQFGGWPWPKEDPVHPRQSGRFAIHANGKRERGV